MQTQINPSENTPQNSPIKSFEIKEDNYTLHRRFDRMGRLVGDDKMRKLFNTHVMIIGLGGVGSWAAESIARSGIIINANLICLLGITVRYSR